MNYNSWKYKRFGRGVGNILLPLSSELDSRDGTYPRRTPAFVSVVLTLSGLTVAIVILLMILNLSFQSKKQLRDLSKSSKFISLNVVEANKNKATAVLAPQENFSTPSPNNEPVVLPVKVEPAVEKEPQNEIVVKKEAKLPTANALIPETIKVSEQQPDAASVAAPDPVSKPIFGALNIDKNLNKIDAYSRKSSDEGIQAAQFEKKQINSGSISINNIQAPTALGQSISEERVVRIESEVAVKEIRSIDIHGQANLQRSVPTGPLVQNTPITRERGVVKRPQIVTSSFSSSPEVVSMVAYSPNRSSSQELGVESRATEGKKAELATFPTAERENITHISRKRVTKSNGDGRTSSNLNVGIERSDKGESNSAEIKTYGEEALVLVENTFSGDTEKLNTGKGVKAAAAHTKVLLKTDDFPVCLGLEEDSRIMSKIVRALRQSPSKRTCSSSVGTFSFTGDLRIMTLSVGLDSKTNVNFTNQCEFLSSALKCLVNER